MFQLELLFQSASIDFQLLVTEKYDVFYEQMLLNEFLIPTRLQNVAYKSLLFRLDVVKIEP